MSYATDPNVREAVVDGLVSVLVARYPRRFAGDQIEQIRKQIEQLVEAGERLRTFRLTNADEPDPIFHAVREEG